MEIVDSFDKIIRPGLWLVKSRQPVVDVSRFVYEIGVELGQPLTVLSSVEKEIKDEVVALIRRNYLEGTPDKLERDWLEQELTEYYTHGFSGTRRNLMFIRLEAPFGQTTFNLTLTVGCL